MESFEWKSGSSTWIHVNGKRLEATCFGPCPALQPTIVMLHEGLGCVELWRSLPERLAEVTGYGVLAYSRSGYGRSDPCPLPRQLDYMTHEACEVLPAVLDAIGFRSGILLGHSDGATIAAIYAGTSEDFRIRGLILIAPHFFTEDFGLKAIEAAGKSFNNQDLRERLAKYHRNPDIAFLGWHDAWTDPGFGSWNVSEVIDYWRIPVMAIQGTDDPYGTMAQIDEIETRIYAPIEKVIMESCGHAPHQEQPDRVCDAIKSFTERLDRMERVNVRVA